MKKNIPEINWNDYKLKNTDISITRLLEENSVKIRNSFKLYIDNVGIKKKSNKITLLDYLYLDEFSLWYSSILYEKNFYKTSQIANCLKLIALRDYIKENKLKKIILVNFPISCKISLKSLSKKLKFNFEIHHIDNDFCINSCINIKNIIPYKLRATITLGKIYAKSLFIGKINNFNIDHNSKKRKIIVSTYFLNFSERLLRRGIFYSDYWGDLIKKMHEWGFDIEWLHTFSTDNKNFRRNISQIRSIRKKNEKHTFLEDNINFRLILNVFLGYLKIISSINRLPDTKFLLDDKNNDLYFHSLLKKEIIDSIMGPNLIRNIMNYFLFKAHLETRKAHRLLYLHEGQGWEKIFLHVSNKFTNIKNIGVIQSPVRFWDIKLFDFPEKQSNKLLPFPNNLALNTFSGLRMMKQAGFPKKDLIGVQSLRKKNINGKKRINENIEMVAFGSFQQIITNELIEILNRFKSNNKIKIIFRPHPGYQEVPKVDKLSINMKDSFNKLVNKSDIVIVAGDSSIAVDTFVANKKMIIYLGQGNLNYSPLRNEKTVKFAKNKNDLLKKLENFINNFHNNSSKKFNYRRKKNNFYIKDDDFLNWKKIIC
jgi:surface carbohydrate biosynthesis protein (TIGR04326 family)